MMRVDLVGWSLLLIALAMSYSVFVKAVKMDNKNLKLLGYVIGVAILAVVLVLAIFDLGFRIRMKRGPIVGSRRIAAPVRPNINLPAFPKTPKAAPETKPVMPDIPAPSAAPKVQ